MPEFLSDEWIAALDERARTLPPVVEVAPFVLEQVVTDPDDADGEQRYRIVFGSDGVRVQRSGSTAADVTFVTDRATAAEIARGETNAQRALAAGSFRVRGDIGAFLARAGVLGSLDDVFADVRDATTYR